MLYNKKREDIYCITKFKPLYNRRIIVMANGPSLRESIRKYESYLKKEQLACVNFFPITEEFTKLKPDFWVLADYKFFLSEKEIEESYANLAKIINKDLDWPMIIVCPEIAKDSFLICQLKDNKNIDVVYFSYNGIPTDIFSPTQLMDLLNKDAIRPPAQTVIHTCLSLFILWRYKEVILIGADLSGFRNTYVDQKTNRLFFNDEHFYESKKRKIDCCIDKYKSALARELEMTAKVLDIYAFLEEYAKYNGVKVYNASEESWIDTFERKELDIALES